MKPMKKYLFRTLAAIIFISMPLSAYSQKQSLHTITGSVADSVTNNSVAYATVAIVDSTMNVVNAVAADMTGSFSMQMKEGGAFELIVSSLGYATYRSPVEIDMTQKRSDLGKILLTPGMEIEEVVIAAQRPLVKLEPDKLVYSVEADPEANSSTLSEILRKVPQLSLDGEDKVLLNGQSNYKVLVNGKSSGMMARNFNDVIKSMPANSIKDIEVITDPSTKYEAEGFGGVINIITHKKTISGYSGRVGASVDSNLGYSGSAYIAAQLGRFNISANYWGNRSNWPEDNGHTKYTNFLSNDARLQTNDSRGKSHQFGQSGWLEASYEIDSMNLLTLSFGLYSGRYTSEFDSESQVFDASDLLRHHYTNDILNKSNNTYIEGSFDYQKTFKKPDRLLTASYKIDGNTSNSTRSDRVEELLAYPGREERSKNIASGSEHTVQVDYFDPINKKHQVEGGLKYILRLNASDIAEERLDASVWQPIPDRLGGLDYNQHILGLYGGYLLKLEKFTFKAGFRMEGTLNTGWAKSADGTVKFDNSNFNVVPYANATFMPKPSQRVQFSYTQRLMRPGIWYLNPYVNRNEYNRNIVSYGNPKLKSVVSHLFSAGYSVFKSSWSIYLGASASFSNNNIVSYTKQEIGSEVLATTYDNIGKTQSYSLSASFNYRLNTLLNIYTNVYAGYNVYEATLPASSPGAEGTYLNSCGFSGNVNAGGNVTLWKDAKFNFNVGLYIPGAALQTRYNNLSVWHSLGITQQLYKKKIDISLRASNPFNRFNINKSTTEQAGQFSMFRESRFVTRSFEFSAGFRFGKMDVDVKKARRTISNDDQMSGGGGK